MIRKKFRTTTRGSMRKIYKKEKGERHREDNFLTFCNRLHDRKILSSNSVDFVIVGRRWLSFTRWRVSCMMFLRLWFLQQE